MAKVVLLNPQIVINSVDLTDHIDMVTIEETFADVETTAFGNTAKTRVAGLGDNKFTAEFQQDYAVSSVEQTIYPLIGTNVSVTVKPVNGTTTSTNPAYTFTVALLDWKPVDGKVGDLEKVSVTWPISGTVTKAIS
jgi:hypothetical protein